EAAGGEDAVELGGGHGLGEGDRGPVNGEGRHRVVVEGGDADVVGGVGQYGIDRERRRRSIRRRNSGIFDSP
ncbi:MAG: hypothetical protein HW386_2399, partial [Gammaproteobacteria bacterium]|nr:hypothetical protein [Gammaproteobacteria bacterium]